MTMKRINSLRVNTVIQASLITYVFLSIGVALSEADSPTPNLNSTSTSTFEFFGPGEFDLGNMSLTFETNDSFDTYTSCITEYQIADFSSDPAGGIELLLGDEDVAVVTLTDGKTFPYWGTPYSTIIVGSNGDLMFSVDPMTEDPEALYELPRIEGLASDLDPGAGGSISWKQTADRVIVTYEDVPEYDICIDDCYENDDSVLNDCLFECDDEYEDEFCIDDCFETSDDLLSACWSRCDAEPAALSSFQIEMFFNGHIRLSFLDIDISFSSTGLFEGAANNGSTSAVDFSEQSPCSDGVSPVLAVNKAIFRCGESIEITLDDPNVANNSATLVIDSSIGDSEVLTATRPTAGLPFVATLSIDDSSDPVATNDGELQVGSTATFTVRYAYHENGSDDVAFISVNAEADCIIPTVNEINITNLEPSSALVSVLANKHVDLQINFGTACDSLDTSVTSNGQDHDIELQNLTPNTTYYYEIILNDGPYHIIDNDNGDCYSFTTAHISDFLTERFESYDFDLSFSSITFIPDTTVNRYRICRPAEPAEQFPIPLQQDDNYAITSSIIDLENGAVIPFFDQQYTSFNVRTNGSVTFGDNYWNWWTFYEDDDEHFDKPRISALFTPLSTSYGGVISWQQLEDRVAVTYQHLTESNDIGSNSFQIELFFDGMIRITYLEISVENCVVGLSRGAGTAADFVESELSDYGACDFLRGAVIVDSQWQSCLGELPLVVIDDNYVGNTLMINVGSLIGDHETIELNHDADNGRYVNSIVVADNRDVAVHGDGILQVQSLGSATIKYLDSNNGWGETSLIAERINIDCEPSIIDLSPDEVTVPLGSPQPNLLEGVTLTDNGDVLNLDAINVSGNIDVLRGGEYQITYTHSDLARNTTTAMRTYRVLEVISLSVDPEVAQFSSDARFAVDVILDSPVTTLDAAEIFMNFDPAVFQVRRITSTDVFDNVRAVNHDNVNGLIEFLADDYSKPETSPFIVMTVEFDAIASIPGRCHPLDFDNTGDRVTAVFDDFGDVLDSTKGGSLCRLRPNTFYVDQNTNPGVQDGMTWRSAFKRIEDALKFVEDGDEIWIAKGIYTPSRSDDRDDTFDINSEIKIYGGFAGGEDSLEDRDWIVNETIMSGEIGDPSTNEDNTRHVVTVHDDAIIDGLEIRHGYADGPTDDQREGGGLRVSTGSPILRNCQFVENSADYQGGAIYVDYSGLTVSNCRFLDNTSKSDGAAIHGAKSNIKISGCFFAENHSGFDGGAVSSWQPSWRFSLPQLEVRDSIFTHNSAKRRGGAISVEYSDQEIVVENSLFFGNSGLDGGGGIASYESELILTNNLFSGNSSEEDGGGIHLIRSDVAIRSCTFANNIGAQGECIYDGDSTLRVMNSVIWTNHESDQPDNVIYSVGPPDSGHDDFSFSIIAGITENLNHVRSVDPLFADFDGVDDIVGTEDDNLTLSIDSPAINAGYNQAAEMAPFDLANSPRIVHGTIDLGAYEFTHELPSVNAELLRSGTINDGIADKFTIQLDESLEHVQVIAATMDGDQPFSEIILSRAASAVSVLVLYGSDDNDSFVIDHRNGEITATLTVIGGNGFDMLTVHGPSSSSSVIMNTDSIVLNGYQTRFQDIDTTSVTTGAGDDTITLSSNFGPLGVSQVRGGAGVDSIVGPDAVNHWVIGADDIDLGPVVLSEIENVTGGTGDDTFEILDGAWVAGKVSGGSGHDTIDFTDVTDADVHILSSGSSGVSGTEATTLGGGFDDINAILGQISSAPEIRTADESVLEGATIEFVVKLSYAPVNSVSVNYTTTDGSAYANQDFRMAAGTLVFYPGENEKRILVNIPKDALTEPDETFSLTLFNAVGGDIATPTVTATINDSAGPIFVNKNASGNGNGSSWADAFTNLLAAIESSNSGDSIWVSAHVYTPDPVNKKRDVSFELRPGVKMFGGFVGQESYLFERDFDTNTTILSGDLDHDDRNDSNRSDNSYHVVDAGDADFDSILDGFTIMSGNADSDGHTNGGGILIGSGTPIIRNCVVAENYSRSNGGGVYIFYSSSNHPLTNYPVFINCVIRDNNASRGGGIHSDNAGLILLNSSVIGNVAAHGSGGGLAVDNYYSFKDPDLTSIVNCIFSGNRANGSGAAIYDTDGPIEVLNTAIINNNADNSCGGIVFLRSSQLEKDSEFTIHNSIIWGNTDEDGRQLKSNLYPSLPTDVAFSNIQFWSDDGEGGNSDSQPLFVDIDGPDDIPGTDDDVLVSRIGSPNLDAGDVNLLPADRFDLDHDGNVYELIPVDIRNRERVRNGAIDIGPYESAQNSVLVSTGIASGLEDDGVADRFRVTMDGGNSNVIVVYGDNEIILNEPLHEISYLGVVGSGDDDVLEVDHTNGHVTVPISFSAGDGDDGVMITVTARNDIVSVGSSAIGIANTWIGFSDTEALVVDLGGGDDVVTLANNATTSPYAANINGGQGADLIHGPQRINNWQISGVNEGALSNVSFADFESIQGGDASDVYHISANAKLTGEIDGGEGLDTIRYDRSVPPLNISGQLESGIYGTELEFLGAGFYNIDFFDGPGLPELTVRDAEAHEGYDIKFDIVLSYPANSDVFVNFATMEVDAEAGVDYLSSNGVTTFLPGDYQASVRIPTSRDFLSETDETFQLQLSDSQNADVKDATGIGTIRDYRRPILVKADAAGDNDGAGWADAYTDLHAAITAATADDEIWVSSGVYYPANAENDRNATFYFDRQISVVGGFHGSEGTVFKRDISSNPTLLSGDVMNDDHVFTNIGENCHHVITVESDSRVVLDGLIIAGGNATDSFLNSDGGGILVVEGELVAENCTITHNIAENGGAIANNGSVVLHNSVIVANKAEERQEGGSPFARGGGGICSRGGSLTVTGCRIEGNSAQTGGGLAFSGGTVKLKFTNVTNNVVAPRAEGLYYIDFIGGGGVFGFGDIEISDSNICNNVVTLGAGGGLYVLGTTIISDSVISNNHVNGNAGGIFNYWGSRVELDRTVLRNNRAGSSGSNVVNDWSSEIEIETSTLISEGSGDVRNTWGSKLYLRNSTCTGSISRSRDDFFFPENSIYNEFGSDDQLTRDGHLLETSMYIDADVASADPYAIDRDGELRPDSGGNDIGSDEFLDVNRNGLPDWFDAIIQTAGVFDSEHDQFGQCAEADSDRDGICDRDEYRLSTNPVLPDTDLDGMWDGEELNWDMEADRYVYLSDPLYPDSLASNHQINSRYLYESETDFQYTAQPCLVDFDMDGDLDFFYCNRIGKLICRENLGSAVSPEWRSPAIIHGPQGFYALGDADNDGDKDIVIMSSGQLYCVKNFGKVEDGKTRWAQPEPIVISIQLQEVTSIAMADVMNRDGYFERDGFEEIVLIGSTDNMEVLANRANSHVPTWAIGKVQYGPLPTESLSDTLGDIDLDGDLDRLLGLDNKGDPIFAFNDEEHLDIRPRYLTVVERQDSIIEVAGEEHVTFSFVRNDSMASQPEYLGYDTSAKRHKWKYRAGEGHSGIDILKGVSTGDNNGLLVINVISRAEADSVGKAVIIAGTRSMSDPLYPISERLAVYAYTVCLQQGYSAENVRLLTPDGLVFSGNDRLPTTSHLGSSVTAYGCNVDLEKVLKGPWAATADDLFVYFADHGIVENDHLVLNMKIDHSVSSPDLKLWLDRWQTTNKRLVVVADTCYSGRLVKELYEGGMDRTVIASSQPDELSHFQSNGIISFSQIFWDELATGASLGQAYYKAITGLSEFDQTPTLDFTGVFQISDGIADNGLYSPSSPDFGTNSDLLISEFGNPRLLSGVQRPVIIEVMDNTTSTEGRANIWVDESAIRSGNGIEKVTAFIIPPNLDTNRENGTAIVDMDFIDLELHELPQKLSIEQYDAIVNGVNDFGPQERQLMMVNYQRVEEEYRLVGDPDAVGVQLLQSVLNFQPRYEAVWNNFRVAGDYRIAFLAEDRWGMLSPVKVGTVTVAGPTTKAVIIECTGLSAHTNTRTEDAIRLLARDASRSLRRRSFVLDPGMDSLPDAGGTLLWFGKNHRFPGKSELQSAISDWADDASHVILFVVGNADERGMLLSNGEIVAASELAGWLQELGTGHIETTIVLDIDHAAAFAEQLSEPNAKRYIIASSGSGSQFRRSRADFSRWLWNGIAKGHTVQGAFAHALTYARSSGIAPPFLLDDDDDGLYDRKRDGRKLRDVTIGTLLPTGDGEIRIGRVSEGIQVEHRGIAQIWAEDISVPDGSVPIVSVAIIPSGISQDNLSGEFEHFDLSFNVENGRFEGQYAFQDEESGLYTFLLQAHSGSDPSKTAIPVPIEVYYDLRIQSADSVAVTSVPRIIPDSDAVTNTTGYVYRLWSVKGDRFTVNAGLVSEDFSDIVLAVSDKHDGTGTVVVDADDWGASFPERIWNWEPPATGWYYITVSEFDKEEADVDFELSVYREQRASADGYETDDVPVLASLIDTRYGEFQDHNFHKSNDEDWIAFYKHQGRSYDITVTALGVNSRPTMELYRSRAATSRCSCVDRDVNPAQLLLECITCENSGIDNTILMHTLLPGDEAGMYYMRIVNGLDRFGSATNYKVSAIDTSTGGFIGISGTITEQGHVPPKKIDLSNLDGVDDNGGQVILSGYLVEDGVYSTDLPPGSYTITASAAGYEPSSMEINLASGDTDQLLSFELEPSGSATYNVSTTVDGGGGHIEKVRNPYVYGANVTLWASADDHFMFSHWSGDVIENTRDNPLRFAISSDMEVTAHFTEKRYLLSFEVDPNCTDCGYPFEGAGFHDPLQEVPWAVASPWPGPTNDGKSQYLAEDAYGTIRMDRDHLIQLEWRRQNWLSIDKRGGGRVDKESDWRNDNEIVTVVATDTDHFVFRKWEVDEHLQSLELTNPILEVPMDKPHAVTAVFALNPDFSEERTVPLNRGWNLISFPYLTDPSEIQDRMMSRIVGPIWRWHGRVVPETVEVTAHRGYWIYCRDTCEITLSTIPVSAGMKKSLYSGWNMITRPVTASRSDDDDMMVWHWDHQMQRFRLSSSFDGFTQDRVYWLHSNNDREIDFDALPTY